VVCNVYYSDYNTNTCKTYLG